MANLPYEKSRRGSPKSVMDYTAKAIIDLNHLRYHLYEK